MAENTHAHMCMGVFYFAQILSGFDLFPRKCYNIPRGVWCMEIKITEKKREILAKRGIYNVKDAIRFFPRTYIDYRSIYNSVSPDCSEKTGCFVGKLLKLTKKSTANKRSCVSFKLLMESEQKININILAQAFMYEKLKNAEGREIVVCGKLEYSSIYGYSILNPRHIAPSYKIKEYSKIEPVYPKLSGISDEFMHDMIAESFNVYQETFYIDKDLEEKYKISTLPDTLTAYRMIHYPKDMNIEKAQQRIVVNELTAFACQLEDQERCFSKGTHVVLKTLKTVHTIIDSLPYTLTDDQKKCLNGMLQSIRSGKRVSALLQGDVGCGKTMVAILMMLAMAENGYQAVLMAPTTILAKQHYAEIKKYADECGIESVYIDGMLSSAEKASALAAVNSGTAKLIVGTQALTTDKIILNRPGMIIIDEEHRFGVEQRASLMKEAQNGVNTLLMSATPIPRTLASTIYGTNTEIYDIKTMPQNRIPIQTAINSSDKVVLEFVKQELMKGRQAYVVCPLIEAGEDTSEDVRSITDTGTLYRNYFEPEFQVGILTGKMKKNEMENIINEYKSGKMHILISTTVIEVGINVPNASVIVISNAERFGLFAMHQLRGRVGRGNYKSYCILFSKDKDNERLKTMVNCRDGFSIAEEDLKLRGAGDLIGTSQSGFTKQMDLALKYPNMYNRLKELAKDIVDRR